MSIINLGLVDQEASGPCRRVNSEHNVHCPIEAPIRRVDVTPLPTPYVPANRPPRIIKYSVQIRIPPVVKKPDPDLAEQLPRITTHIVAQRFKIYIPGSSPPINITRAAETTEVRKIDLGPVIKRSFIRRTFHPLNKKFNLIKNNGTLVRPVISTQEDPFPEHREVRHSETPITVPANGTHSEPRPVSRYLSIQEHIIDRPEVKTTYMDTHCCLSTALRILQDVGTLVY